MITSTDIEILSADKWNKMAKPCSHYERFSSYAREFIEKSGIKDGDTVFDMGCGSGTLCLPLSDMGHDVFCGDFSDNMLKSVADTIAEEGITNIRIQKMSYLSDWDQLDVPVCDYVFCSRSLFDVDPAIVIPKLSAHARKKVCITIHLAFNDMKLSGFTCKADDSASYFKACISAILDLHYYPQVEYMDSFTKGESGGWAFISWEV